MLRLACCCAWLAAAPVHARAEGVAPERWSEGHPTSAGQADAAADAFRASFFGGALAVQARTLFGEALPDAAATAANDAASRRLWRGAELRGQSNAFAQHQLVLRLQALNDAPISAWSEDARPPPDARAEGALRFGLHASDMWQVAPRLVATTDMQLERADGVEGRCRSRAALAWQASAATIVNLLVVRSEIPTQDDGRALAYPRLGAEQSETVELAADHRFDGAVRVRGAAYQRWLRGPVTLDGEPVTLSVPGPSLAQGLGLSTEMRLGRGVRVDGSLALQQARGADDVQVANLPTLLGRLSLSLPLADWRLAYELRFGGDRADAEGNAVGGYAMSGLQLRTERLVSGLDLALSVRNLFDQQGAASGDGVGAIDGRNVAVNARWRF